MGALSNDTNLLVLLAFVQCPEL